MGRNAANNLFNLTLILSLCLISSMFALVDSRAEESSGNQNEFIYSQDERVDPFIELLSSKGLKKEMGSSSREEMLVHLLKIKVSGIMWDETMPIAMINKKMRKEGDVVKNLTIKKINVNSVILEYCDQTHEIVLIKKKKMDDQGGI
ncbi:MAG: hypothetical protein KAS13_03835 [Candidatus Omnitrophica bacterium]|nr:hypothetical protein [Candidatus Omnitrophota bacterium]